MSKKISLLVNGVTFDDGNLVPLISKVRYFKKRGISVNLIGSRLLYKKMGFGLIDNFINLNQDHPPKGRYSYIYYALKRNLMALVSISNIHPVKVVYSISSVLDHILIPFMLKKTKKSQKWVTVFDNTVPLFSGGKVISGDFVIRLLAWIFYEISLLFLRSADKIFVVKKELKDILVGRGFIASKLVVTGNGVEGELILNAKKRKSSSFDILFIGRINEAKGIYDLLKTISLVKKKVPKVSMAIMGKGDLATEERFKSKIKSLKLAKNISLLGFKTGQEKYDIIKSSKVFVFLSQTESVPVAPLEAVCSGLNTIVYDLDAYNMYKKGEILKCKQGDYKSVARKVVEIVTKTKVDNKPRLQLIRKHSWESVAKTEYISILRSI